MWQTSLAGNLVLYVLVQGNALHLQLNRLSVAGASTFRTIHFLRPTRRGKGEDRNAANTSAQIVFFVATSMYTSTRSGADTPPNCIQLRVECRSQPCTWTHPPRSSLRPLDGFWHNHDFQAFCLRHLVHVNYLNRIYATPPELNQSQNGILPPSTGDLWEVDSR